MGGKTIKKNNIGVEKEKNSKEKITMAIVAVLVLYVAIFAMVKVYHSSARRLEQQLNLGNRYLEEMDYEQAIIAFDKVLEIDPKNVGAYLGKADAFISLGDTAMAIKTLEAGRQAAGEDEAIKNRLLDIYDQIEKEALYGEHVVDGIYHHGYTFYDLSGEETALLDELISYMETGRYEEYAVMLNTEEYIQAWKALAGKYESNMPSIAHIAYNGYKIFAYDFSPHYYGGSGGDGICVIPVEDGMGALYGWSLGSEYGSYIYTYCECSDGMFNGNLKGHSRLYSSAAEQQWVDERIVEGEVANGLINGRFSEYRPTDMKEMDVNGDGFVETYSTFDYGRPTGLVEFGEVGNGGVSYIFGENGETAGYMQADESFEKARDALAAMVFYVSPRGYSICSDVTQPEMRYVGEDSGAYIYSY